VKDFGQINLQFKKPNQCVKRFTVLELILDKNRPEGLIDEEVEN
jgi:hypothetical protein